MNYKKNTILDIRSLIDAFAVRLLLKDAREGINENVCNEFETEQDDSLIKELYDLGYAMIESDFENPNYYN